MIYSLDRDLSDLSDLSDLFGRLTPYTVVDTYFPGTAAVPGVLRSVCSQV